MRIRVFLAAGAIALLSGACSGDDGARAPAVTASTTPTSAVTSVVVDTAATASASEPAAAGSGPTTVPATGTTLPDPAGRATVPGTDAGPKPTLPPESVQPPQPPGTPVDTAFTGEGSDALCANATPLLEARNAVFADSEGIQAELQAVDAAFAQALTVAPAEIKPDMEMLRNAYMVANAFYAKYGYDQSAVEAAAIADPAVAEELAQVFDSEQFYAAGQRFDAYLATVCGASA